VPTKDVNLPTVQCKLLPWWCVCVVCVCLSVTVCVCVCALSVCVDERQGEMVVECLESVCVFVCVCVCVVCVVGRLVCGESGVS